MGTFDLNVSHTVILQMSQKNLNQQYQKKELQQHIYDTPDTYVGGCDLIDEMLPIFEGNKILLRSTEFIPALYNTFNEILVNARDQAIRLKDVKEYPVTRIDVSINEETGQIMIKNDGSGIDVAIHPSETKVDGSPLYIPEMIFGHLLTSTNYDKDEKKVVGGKNGYGAKLTNIFSTSFAIETVDHVRQQKYSQIFRNNMTVSGNPQFASTRANRTQK